MQTFFSTFESRLQLFYPGNYFHTLELWVSFTWDQILWEWDRANGKGVMRLILCKAFLMITGVRSWYLISHIQTTGESKPYNEAWSDETWVFVLHWVFIGVSNQSQMILEYFLNILWRGEDQFSLEGLPSVTLVFHTEYFSWFLKNYLFLAVLGLHCCSGLSLAVAREGYFLAAICQLLVAWSTASLFVEHGLKGAGLL